MDQRNVVHRQRGEGSHRGSGTFLTSHSDISISPAVGCKALRGMPGALRPTAHKTNKSLRALRYQTGDLRPALQCR